MSSQIKSELAAVFPGLATELRRNWGWLLALGICLL